jgi:NADPH:quinone reductase-like Zn-dependent oxidoreductase
MRRIPETMRAAAIDRFSVGTLALQFAKLRGARVLATASGRDGVKGVDAVLATAGGKPLEQCLRAVRRAGRWCSGSVDRSGHRTAQEELAWRSKQASKHRTFP